MEEASRSLESLVGTQGPAAAEAIHHTARGLRDVHAARCLHNDVKPSNILLVGERWKVGDFGIARPLADGTHTFSSWADGDYAAPERKRGEVRTAGDVWSLGITAHEVLTGTLPAFGSDTALSARLPPGWRDLLEECLRADPRSRPDIGQVVAATGALSRQARAAAALTPSPPPPPAPSPRSVAPEPERRAHSEVGRPADTLTRVLPRVAATRRFPAAPAAARPPAAPLPEAGRAPVAAPARDLPLAPHPVRRERGRARRRRLRAERRRRSLVRRVVGGLFRAVLALVWAILVAAAVVAGVALALQLTAAELTDRANDLVDRGRAYLEDELGTVVEDVPVELPGSPSG
jgi:hypothetical protein